MQFDIFGKRNFKGVICKKEFKAGSVKAASTREG
jgi:hypothetical protein